MRTWYAIVETYERFGQTNIQKRKIELDGWKDRPEVASYVIGDWCDNRDVLEQYNSYEEFCDDVDNDTVDIKPDGVSCSVREEEHCSGVATSKEKAMECYCSLKQSDDNVIVDEWK